MKIKLHTQGGILSRSQTILIDSGNIDRVLGDEDEGSIITMKDDTRYEVKETPEEIHEMIEDKPVDEKKEDKK